MAVKIRLKRMGKIREPHYRLVVVDSRKKRDGRVIEEIGYYNPNTEPSVIDINSERAQYWISVGAQPSEAALVQLKLTGDWQAVKGGEVVNTLKTLEKKNVEAEREAAVKAVQDSAEKRRAEKAAAIAKAEAEAAEAKAAEEAASAEAAVEEAPAEEPAAEEEAAE